MPRINSTPNTFSAKSAWVQHTPELRIKVTVQEKKVKIVSRTIADMWD